MIISHSAKYVFVHIPKCGGESVEVACGGTLRLRDVLIGARGTGGRPRGTTRVWRTLTGLGKHSTAEEIRNRMGEGRFRSYYSFAIVRHPADRLRSLYKYSVKRVIREPGFQALAGDALNNGATWEEAVSALWDRLGCAESDRRDMLFDTSSPGRPDFLKARLYGIPTTRLALLSGRFRDFLEYPDLVTWEIGRPQACFIYGPGGEQLVDGVFRLETIGHDWPGIADRIGADPNLPHKNSSANVPGLVFGSDDDAVVRARYRQDYELLGYD